MKAARARRTFRRSDNKQIVHQGRPIEDASEEYVAELVRNRLADYVSAAPHAPETKAPPSDAASIESSASQAARASRKTTSKESADGGSKKKPAPKKAKKKTRKKASKKKAK